MKKIIYIYITLQLLCCAIFAKNNITTIDSISGYTVLPEANIISNRENTSDINTLPASTTVFSPIVIGLKQVSETKDLNANVPNLYMPDYGSQLTSAMYMRGLGARGNGQSAVGLYVDNIPYLDKSSYDFELSDIQRIEFLNGPQGTLYGRNAMAGIINIYRLSPIESPHNTISLSAGNYGYVKANFSHFNKINDNFGYALNAYFKRGDGFLSNQFTNKTADNYIIGGTNIQLEWRMKNNWKSLLNIQYEYCDEDAFAYGIYDKDSKELNDVNYNRPGNYLRNMSNNSLLFKKSSNRFDLILSTGFHYLKDDMNMDQDYTTQDNFTLNQQQNEYSVSEEILLHFHEKNNLKWSAGGLLYYQSLKTDATVTFQKDGIQNILKPNIPAPLLFTDSAIPIPGIYETPTFGSAIFGEITFNHLFIKNLSATLGLRLNADATSIDYHTEMRINYLTMISQHQGAMTDTLDGNTSTTYISALPKFALKYNFSNNNFIYGTIAMGYKSGGYNIQTFGDIMQQSLMQKYGPGTIDTLNVNKSIAYEPEYCWNYEIGWKNTYFDNKLSTQLALFYMDINNLQITQFVESTQGRMTSNAGKARSWGIEASMLANVINDNFFINFTYGYTNAIFTKYSTVKKINGVNTEIDYAGNYIPYSPSNTVSVGLTYSKNIDKKLLDKFIVHLQCTGLGKIYWSETNDAYQDFYTMLDGKISFVKSMVQLDIWSKNILNTNYNAFVFESGSNAFGQQGNPFQIGASLICKF